MNNTKIIILMFLIIIPLASKEISNFNKVEYLNSNVDYLIEQFQKSPLNAYGGGLKHVNLTTIAGLKNNKITTDTTNQQKINWFLTELLRVPIARRMTGTSFIVDTVLVKGLIDAGHINYLSRAVYFPILKKYSKEIKDIVLPIKKQDYFNISLLLLLNLTEKEKSMIDTNYIKKSPLWVQARFGISGAEDKLIEIYNKTSIEKGKSELINGLSYVGTTKSLRALVSQFNDSIPNDFNNCFTYKKIPIIMALSRNYPNNKLINMISFSFKKKYPTQELQAIYLKKVINWLNKEFNIKLKWNKDMYLFKKCPQRRKL